MALFDDDNVAEQEQDDVAERE